VNTAAFYLRCGERRTKMNKKWLKYGLFIFIHMATSYFLGRMCDQLSLSYELILSPSRELFYMLLFLLLSLGGVIISAGIVALLMKPLWISAVAFLLSSMSIIIGWQQFTITVGIILFVYFVIFCYAAHCVHAEQKERIHFSTKPFKDSLGLFSIALLIVACGSVFIGSKDAIDRNGFEIPASYLEIFMDPFKEQALSQVPYNERSQVEEGFEEQMQGMMDGFTEKIKPFENYIPLIIGITFLTPLLTVNQILSSIWLLVLQVVIKIFTTVGIIEIVTETRDVEKAIID